MSHELASAQTRHGQRLSSIPEIHSIDREPLIQVLSAMKRAIETLNGERGWKGDSGSIPDKTERAVKYGDVHIADALPLQSAQIGGAPSQADYNALQADVEELHKRYNYLAALLRGEQVGQ